MTASQAPQVAFAKRAPAIKARSKSTKLSDELIEANNKAAIEEGLSPDTGRHRHDRERVHAPRAPPVRLLNKAEVLSLTGVTFPTIWTWMRAGKFPRARIIGKGSNSKSVWRSDEVEQWLADLPVRRLKGDAA